MSSQPYSTLPNTAGFQVLTPNPRAARTLGAKFDTVEQAAQRILQRHGLLAPSEIVRRYTLREAVREVIKPTDLGGYTRVVAATVQEILRAGFPYIDLGTDLTERASNLLALTLRYRGALRQLQLVDPAEVLWAAAELEPDPAPLLIAGYPRLGKGETAFLCAVAGEDSVLVLPTGAHPSFGLNTADRARARARRGRRGWGAAQPTPRGLPAAPPADAPTRLAEGACRANGRAA